MPEMFEDNVMQLIHLAPKVSSSWRRGKLASGIPLLSPGRMKANYLMQIYALFPLSVNAEFQFSSLSGCSALLTDEHICIWDTV